MFAVLVHFRIRPEDMAAFLPLIGANAASALAEEPGCRRFDILTDPDRPDAVALYELYDSEAAFLAHRETEHVRRFGAAAADLIVERTLTTWREVSP